MIPVNKDLISQIVFYDSNKNSTYEPEQKTQKLTNKIIGQVNRIFSNQSSNAVNIDLFDLGTILKCTDNALLGLAEAKGPDRAIKAISKALKRDENQMAQTSESKMALLSIVSGKTAELEMDELTLMTEYMVENLGENTEIIFGHSESKKLEDRIQVMVIVSAQ